MRLKLPLWVLVPLILSAEAVLIGLGVWQWQRYGAKQELEAQFIERTTGAPMSVAMIDLLPEAERDFQLVQVSGRWDAEHLFRVSNRYRASVQGEEAIVPLLLEDGRAVLVNRGWYPLDQRERVLGDFRAQVSGEVHGLTRIRPDLNGGPLQSGAWSRFDAASMYATLPYRSMGWVLIEGDMLAEPASVPPTVIPATGWVAFRNDVPHLEYALTWWGLALVLPVFIGARVFTEQAARRREASVTSL
ncbi:MAG: SURF1 family protein [Dehalococcoidia bacterium]|nr:SURF1 family protein [Dehalococcoidia bacterium]